MPTEEDLLQAIDKLESEQANFEICQKLAVYYYLYDKYYNRIRTTYNSDSEFMSVVAGTSTDHLLAVMDELMECVAVINPKLYTSVLEKLEAY